MSRCNKRCNNQDDQELLEKFFPQGASCADPLLDNFRDDLSCRIIKELSGRGITFCELLKFGEKITVIYPWNAEYDKYRQNVNRRFNFYPWMIVLAKSTKDVIIAIKWARRHKIKFRTRSGGHCFESFSLSNEMIIDQSERDKIRIEQNFAILQPGCLLGKIALKLSKKGYAFVGGTCPNVAVAGLTLGGGIGPLVRKYGLTCDNLIEIEIVLANGKCIRANNQEHSDIFWACQGGGNGNFGIITEFVFKIHKIARVLLYNFEYEYDKVIEVLDTWQHWAPFTDKNLGAELNIYSNRVEAVGIYLYPIDQKTSDSEFREKIEKLLSPMLKLKPSTASIKELPYIDAARHFAGKGYWYPFFKNKSGFVKKMLPMKAMQIIKEQMKNGFPEDHVELNAFGGKMFQIESDDTAFPHRKNTLYWAHLQAHWEYQSQDEERLEWIRNFYNELSPYLSGAYTNAPDTDLGNKALKKYYESNITKLIEIKHKYDPCNLFNYEQSIPLK